MRAVALGCSPLFPAYAGVILMETLVDKWGITFPRIRGGDPPAVVPVLFVALFSPHTRG